MRPKAKFDLPTQRFSNLYRVPASPMGFKETLKVMYAILHPSRFHVPEYPIPQMKPDTTLFAPEDEHVRFMWFGHSTLLVHLEKITILIDPMFSSYASPIKGTIKRFQAPVLALNKLPHIDVIVISHDHYDHLDKKSIQFFKHTATRFLVPLGIKRYLTKWGIDEARITELNWHEFSTIGDVTFRATPAHHFSGRSLWSRNTTLWASWILEGKTKKLFFSGDSAYSPHFKEIGEMYGPFDLAFMENGQYNTRWLHAHMMPEQSIQAIKDVQAKLFVPIHWGMFRLSTHHWLEPMVRSLALMEKETINMLNPFIGEIITLS